MKKIFAAITLASLAAAGAQTCEEAPFLAYRPYSTSGYSQTAYEIERLNRQIYQYRQEQREAELERHYQAERDYTWKVIFGK